MLTFAIESLNIIYIHDDFFKLWELFVLFLDSCYIPIHHYVSPVSIEMDLFSSDP